MLITSDYNHADRCACWTDFESRRHSNGHGTLSAYPPKGWDVDTVESHSSGSYLSKLQAYNKAKNRLEELIGQTEDIVIHLHAASDYSFLRKLRLAEHASKLGAKIVFQIHSGNILAWLGKKDRAKK